MIRSDGRITIRFMYFKTKSWIEDRTVLNEFRERLNKIPGMDLNEKDLGGKPKRPLDLLLNPSNLNLFKSAVTWLREQALSAGK
ncbi:MAG: hypothetical protein CAF45_010860 [Nitrospira sp. CG24E]|nr:MAG: hypothetical protein CAF45_010860 [Nitrospira sp. CG24E]